MGRTCWMGDTMIFNEEKQRRRGLSTFESSLCILASHTHRWSSDKRHILYLYEFISLSDYLLSITC